MGTLVKLRWFRSTPDPALAELLERLDGSPAPRRGPRIGRGTSGLPVAQVRGVLAERVVVSTDLRPFLSLKALARYSGLSVRNLRDRLTHPGHPLPHYRIGGKIVIHPSDYDAWAARYRQVGNPDLERIVAEAVRGVRTAPKPRGRARAA